MARAFGPETNLVNCSIKSVWCDKPQQPSSANNEKPLPTQKISDPAQITGNTLKGRQNSITVTKTLDVSTVMSSDTNASNMPQQVSVVDFAAEKPGAEPLATNCQTASLQDGYKHNDMIPSSEDTHHSSLDALERHARPGAPVPTKPDSLRQVSHKPPAFQQSKRWAREHTNKQSEKSTPEVVSHLENDESRTMKKEVAPQQQKDEIQRGRARVQSTISDSDPSAQNFGLCRSLSMPTLQLWKQSSSRQHRKVPVKWISRRVGHYAFRIHRAREVSNQNSRQEISSTSPGRQPKRCIRPRRAFADLRKRASYQRSEAIANGGDKVVRLDDIDEKPRAPKSAASPVPTLHDPEKAKRFSQECEAILSNADFDRDWLVSHREPLSNLGQHLNPVGTFGGPLENSKKPKLSDWPRRSSWAKGDVSSSVAQTQALSHALQEVTGPDPPQRTSSKGIRLATAVEITKPRCVSVTTGCVNGILLSTEDGADVLDSNTHQPQQRRSEEPRRMASMTSAVEPARSGVKAAKSTDTLAKIEAHLQDNSHPSIGEKVKPGTVFIIPPSKQPVASKAPPEEPLPDLPLKTARTPSAIIHRRRGNDKKLGRQHRHQRSVAEQLVDSLLEKQASTMSNHDQGDGENAATHDLAIDTSQTVFVESHAMPTPSSIYSQESFHSRAPAKPSSLTRHDISRFRHDRVKDVRSQVKADMVRGRRISERAKSESESLILPPHQSYSSGLSGPLGSLTAQPSIDQLDQFPAVPVSRPQSIASKKSRNRSHGRHNSRKSESSQKKSYRAAISKSDVRILVDCSPIDGEIHLSAAKTVPAVPPDDPPYPASQLQEPKSVAGNPVEERATKRTSSKTSSAKSFRSNLSAARTHRPFTFDNVSRSQIGSDDDTRSLISTANSQKNSKRKLRRRWNSKDIAEIHMMHQDLVSCQQIIMRQEKELRKQREEIQMMVRVYAPLIRQHAFKQTFRGLDTTRDGQHRLSSSSSPHRSSASQRQQRLTPPILANSSKPARPMSALSSASEITNGSLTYGTTGSSSASQGEASLADPLDFVPIPTSSRPGSRDTLSTTLQALHGPPPVASVIHRAKLLPEEMSLLSGKAGSGCGIAAGRSGPAVDGIVMREAEGFRGDEGGDDVINRLSLNHYLTSTEDMDRALQM